MRYTINDITGKRQCRSIIFFAAKIAVDVHLDRTQFQIRYHQRSITLGKKAFSHLLAECVVKCCRNSSSPYVLKLAVNNKQTSAAVPEVDRTLPVQNNTIFTQTICVLVCAHGLTSKMTMVCVEC